LYKIHSFWEIFHFAFCEVTFPYEEGYLNISEQVTEQVTEQVKRLLKSLDDSMSIKILMNKLSLKHRPTFLYDYLQPAIDMEFIEMTQPDSPKSATQKYRLTAKGMQIKKHL
jgi:ATP-dependent DNA helicase RecG